MSTLADSARVAAVSGVDLLHALTCNSLLALAELTAAGVGISVFPRHYCFDWRRDDIRKVITVLREVVARLADFSIPPRLTSIGERQ